MGDTDGESVRPTRYQFLPIVVIVVIVAVARLIGGDAPLPVVAGAVIFGGGYYAFVVRWKSRLGKVESTATRQRMATRRVRVGGLALVGIAAGFAFAGIWGIAALLVFLAAFFNGAAWLAQRYGQPRRSK